MSLADKLNHLFEKEDAVLAVDGKQEPASMDLQVAAAALLLEAAYGDEEFHRTEKQVIETGLQKEFGLSDAETKNLLRMANDHRLTTGDVIPFLKKVSVEYSPAQKEKLLEMIRSVVEADGRVRIVESVLYDFVREQLGLSSTKPESEEVPK